jgi:hypothetical protein
MRRVPRSYIRDVTHTQGFPQTLFGVSSIKVLAMNGDSIELENIFEGGRKRESIWELVLARSSQAFRSRNVYR